VTGVIRRRMIERKREHQIDRKITSFKINSPELFQEMNRSQSKFTYWKGIIAVLT
jgi:hypothetical protein